MKSKELMRSILLLFVGACVGVLISQSMKKKADVESVSTPDVVAASQPKGDGELKDDGEQKASNEIINVYYFFGGKRCVSCRKIEAYTQEAVQKYFADEMKSGKVVWLPINMDNAQNAHYAEDFELYSKSVVVAKARGGKTGEWKNLKEIWMLVADKDGFMDYIRENVAEYLEAK